MTKLVKLDLSWSGSAISSMDFKNLPKLKYLNISNNHLDKLPEGIDKLENLEELILNNNNFKDTDLNTIGSMTNLLKLDLSRVWFCNIINGF